MNVEHRRDRQFPGRSNFTPGENSVRGVKIQMATLARLDHGLGIIAEELIEVVQVSESFRMNIRGVQGAVSYLITSSDLKLAVKFTATVGQRKDANWSRGDGRQNELMYCIALLVSNADQQIADYFPIDLEVPDLAAWVLQAVGDDV